MVIRRTPIRVQRDGPAHHWGRALAAAIYCLAGLPAVGNTLAAPYAPPDYYAPTYYGQPYYAPPDQGQQTQPTQPAQPPTQPSQFRPIPRNNAQGALPLYQPPPAQQRMPGQPSYGYPNYPGYQQNWAPNYAHQPYIVAPSTPPKLQWRIETRDPYLQQPVVLHLDVISGDNLSTANLEFSASDDLLIKRFKGPDTSTRDRNGQREIVNSFVLTIVPLRAGNLEVPAITVTGDQVAGGLTQRYTASTERPIRLQVRPSMTSVRPWLPLKSLTLSSRLDREGALEPGQPVTLTLEMTASGATAIQLPSLESQLNGPGLRVYREQTLSDTQLSPDARTLTATRTEYYTLVPQGGGRVEIPAMSIAWWNVEQGVREVARLPIKTLSVRGGGPFGFSASALADSGWAKIWIPLTGLMLLVSGYWFGVFYRGRTRQLSKASLGALTHGARAGLGLLVRRSRPYLAKLTPAAILARARHAAHRHMPASSHLLRCIRQANRATTATQWCALFEQASRDCLQFKGDLTQPALTRQILALRPAASRDRLEALMQQLDAARYGRQSIDFAEWKQALMEQVRPSASLARRPKTDTRVRWAALPALNPKLSV